MKSTTRLTPVKQPEQRDYRKELWIGIAVSVARAEAAKSSHIPGMWANRALADFDKRFGETG